LSHVTITGMTPACVHELITFMLNFQEAALPPEIINVLQSIQSSACNFYTLSFAAVNTSE